MQMKGEGDAAVGFQVISISQLKALSYILSVTTAGPL
jgi:hypothetical protein